jgi:hypothetical protein
VPGWYTPASAEPFTYLSKLARLIRWWAAPKLASESSGTSTSLMSLVRSAGYAGRLVGLTGRGRAGLTRRLSAWWSVEEDRPGEDGAAWAVPRGRCRGEPRDGQQRGGEGTEQDPGEGSGSHGSPCVVGGRSRGAQPTTGGG